MSGRGLGRDEPTFSDSAWPRDWKVLRFSGFQLTLGASEFGGQGLGTTILPWIFHESSMILHVSPPCALVDGPAHFFPQWRGNDLRLFGPLSIQAKLLHSPEQALAKLWVELPQDNPKCVAVISKAVRLRPGLLHAVEKGNIYTHAYIYIYIYKYIYI